MRNNCDCPYCRYEGYYDDRYNGNGRRCYPYNGNGCYRNDHRNDHAFETFIDSETLEHNKVTVTIEPDHNHRYQ